MIADGFWTLHQSSGGNVVRSVHAMFHSDKGNRLVADKTHRFCAPHRQHKCILVSPLFLKFAIFGINFSFFVGIRARHDFRLLRNRSQIDLPALFDTHNLRDPQISRPTLSEWVVIVMLLLQLLIGPLDWTRKIETTSCRDKIYSANSRTNKNSLGSWFN